MSGLRKRVRDRTIFLQNAFDAYISGYSSLMCKRWVLLKRRSSDRLQFVRAHNGHDGDAHKPWHHMAELYANSSLKSHPSCHKHGFAEYVRRYGRTSLSRGTQSVGNALLRGRRPEGLDADGRVLTEVFYNIRSSTDESGRG
jgi:hypothetical protein